MARFMIEITATGFIPSSCNLYRPCRLQTRYTKGQRLMSFLQISRHNALRTVIMYLLLLPCFMFHPEKAISGNTNILSGKDIRFELFINDRLDFFNDFFDPGEKNSIWTNTIISFM